MSVFFCFFFFLTNLVVIHGFSSFFFFTKKKLCAACDVCVCVLFSLFFFVLPLLFLKVCCNFLVDFKGCLISVFFFLNQAACFSFLFCL